MAETTETKTKKTEVAKAATADSHEFGETTKYKTDETPNIDNELVNNFFTGETQVIGSKNPLMQERPAETGDPAQTAYVPTAQEEYSAENDVMSKDDRFANYWKNNGA